MSLDEFKLHIKYIDYNRIFLLSDTHLGVRANSLEWLSNIRDFFKNFYIPYVKRTIQPGDIMCFLGDFFDNRQLLDINVLNVGIDIIMELAEILPVYMLTGNHDIYKKYDTDVNSIVAFKHIPNVIIFEKPLVISNGHSKILILPWIGDKEKEENYVRANKIDYIFAHTTISGFKYDNDREIGIASTDFSKFKNIKRVFSGHIHKRQELRNLLYIGSPYHTKRSDIGNSKGLYIFNPKENSYEFTLNDYSPAFQKVLLSNLLEFTLETTSAFLNNNYTDIIVADKHIHLFNLTKFVDILQDCKYKKIEAVNEKKRLDEELSDAVEGVDIRDILTLLELSIGDLGHQTEVLIHLKMMNKRYYEKANKETDDYLNINY